MVRLNQIAEPLRSHLADLPCPTFDGQPWVGGPAVEARRVAIVSTAGIHRRDDRPYAVGATDYRIVPGETAAADLVMSHASINFDRSGFQEDVNVVFPIDRLRALKDDGVIGSLGSYHYTLLGTTHPEQMEESVKTIAGLLKDDGVDSVFLVGV